MLNQQFKFTNIQLYTYQYSDAFYPHEQKLR